MNENGKTAKKQLSACLNRIQDCWPKPEDLSYFAYAITISPDPYGYFYPSVVTTTKQALIDWQENFILKKLIPLTSCRLRLYPEFSRTGRWHFHGLLSVDPDKVCEFYFHDVPILQLMCNIDLRSCADPMGWHLYCTKNTEILKREMPFLFWFIDSQREIKRYLLAQQQEQDDLSQFVKDTNTNIKFATCSRVSPSGDLTAFKVLF